MLRHLMKFVLLLGIALAAPSYADDEDALVVSAAASLTDAFKEIGKNFEAATGSKVVFNFAASGNLLQQIVKGAPADVFASADEVTMKQGLEKDLIEAASVKNFVSNKMVMIVPIDSKLAITKPQELTLPVVKRIAVGNLNVPIGRYTQESLTAEKLYEGLKPKFIYADTVRQALDYVAKSEVDVGFVYSTDAEIAKQKVKVVATLGNHSPILYPIGSVKDSRNHALAQQFIDFVTSEASLAVLTRYGFGKP
ncbi:MAG: molybdate ABC transporter substrate-binding protein [Thiotrichaceae bacterium]|nr:molybdate ABC transporter substrate-binding protein [Thiotrichaceae bacterium]